MVRESSAKPLKVLQIMLNSNAPMKTEASSSFLVFILVLRKRVEAMMATMKICTVLKT